MGRALTLAAALLAAHGAGAVELTIDAVNAGLSPTSKVRIVSGGVGGGALRSCGGLLAQEVELTGGTGTIDLEPSADCGFPQEYAAVQGSQRIPFSMPATASTLSALIVVPGERGPCTVTTDPQGPRALARSSPSLKKIRCTRCGRAWPARNSSITSKAARAACSGG